MAATDMTSHNQRGERVRGDVRGQGQAKPDALIDALIEAAPQLIRQRQLLPAFDWSNVGMEHIQRLVERLDKANMVMPDWLARDILVSGQPLPAHTTSALPPELQVLSRLNGMHSGHPGEELLVEISDLVTIAPLSGGSAAVIVRRLGELGAGDAACALALAAWPATPRALHHARTSFASHLQTLPVLKAGVAGFSTTSTFAKALVPAFGKRGVRIEVDEAPFGSAIAALHAPAEGTQASLIVLDPQTLLHASWRMGVDAAARDFTARLEALEQAVTTFSTAAGLPLLINTLPAGSEPSMGYMDGYHQAGLASLTRRTNEALAGLAGRFANLILIDTDVALARLAHDARYDPRLWFYGRIAYAEPAVNAIADAYSAAWAMRQAKPVKVVALDFDNTLWGGVFGDDGIERLQCGDDPPGNAYKALQVECLRLKAQGKLLVALSKNNPDALAVLDQHPGMALRPDDFAATAVNWQPKPENIRRIAADLNLGLDSFLFLDDSPHEREAMRRLCPEVRVPEMPADPAARPCWLRGVTDTWPARLTVEDIERPAMYLAERKAHELKATAANYDDYLRGLEQRLTIEPLTARTLPRVAQLHERTNQFNPTTQRFTEADLGAFMSRPDSALVLLGTAEDRFGNHGIVIAAVARIDGTTAHIDSLVMSCRVIARQIETAFLGALIDMLCQRGVTEVIASYRPTAKNGLVRDLYPGHGLLPLDTGSVDTGEREARHWIWRANQQQLPASAFVTIEWSSK